MCRAVRLKSRRWQGLSDWRIGVKARLAAVVLVVSMIGALTGCTFWAAQTNQKPYDPSDGFGVTLGDVAIRNALLVSQDGKNASLAVAIVNSGSKSATLHLSWKGAAGNVQRNVYIAAGATQSFGPVSNQIVLHDIDSIPGSLFPVYFQHGDTEGREIRVPVLDGSLPSYKALVPAPSS